MYNRTVPVFHFAVVVFSSVFVLLSSMSVWTYNVVEWLHFLYKLNFKKLLKI